jgi:peptide-methionine (R)-S-oxide reductase
MTGSDYRPIDCSVYDKLEETAVRGTVAHFLIRDEDGGEREIQDRVQDIYARDGVEYMKTAEGLEIRLDRLRAVNGEAVGGSVMVDKLRLSEEEWRRRLSPEEYRVLREHGTEPAGSGCLLEIKEQGTYVCAACGNPLFESGEKFESGTGWPSFTQPASPHAVSEHEDRSYGMTRTEVRCVRCGSHLGHVFPDGPPPTGLRYCMNSVALKHVPEGERIPLVTE